MAAIVAQTWTGFWWGVRGPQTRRRLLATARAFPEARFISVRDLAQAAGVAAASRRQIEAAISELVEIGHLEGIRGDYGWLAVRAAVPSQGTAHWEQGEPARIKGLFQRQGHGTSRHQPAQAGPDSGHSSSRVPPPAHAFPRGAMSPVSRRTFSQNTRVRTRAGGRLVGGILLFLVAVAASTVAIRTLILSNETTNKAPSTRTEWYRQAAVGYVATYGSGAPETWLPYRFTAVTGIATNAARTDLIQGMEHYLQSALLTADPAHAGLVAWARAELGELPAAPDQARWVQDAAARFAERSAAGTPGYEITPVLARVANLPADTRDAEQIAGAVAPVITAGLHDGSPMSAGLIEWARRAYGELPAQ